jgi:hypothetical protein
MLLILLAACQGASDEPSVADACVALDDASVGAPFRLTYCTACHASGRVGQERHGAPEGMDFDDRDGVMAHAARVAARVSEGTMPPGGGPTEEERRRFLDWMACGAPGRVEPWIGAASARDVLGAWDVVEESVDEDGLLVLRVYGSGTGRTATQDILEEERWSVGTDHAALLERTRWSADDGSWLLTDIWTPPLTAVGPYANWTWGGIRTRVEPAGEQSRDETWTFARGPETEADPRLNGSSQERVDGVEDASGASLALWLSAAEGLVARRFVADGADPDAGAPAWESMQYPQGFREPASSPIGAPGRVWSAAMLVAEAP